MSETKLAGPYSKRQLLSLLARWSVSADFPTKRKDVLIAFPIGHLSDNSFARISLLRVQSPRLYNVHVTLASKGDTDGIDQAEDAVLQQVPTKDASSGTASRTHLPPDNVRRNSRVVDTAVDIGNSRQRRPAMHGVRPTQLTPLSLLDASALLVESSRESGL